MYKPIGLITRLISLCLLILPVWVKGQNSVLVNFGSNSCWPPGSPNFSLISNPLQPAPQVLANCSFAAQVPDIYNVFVAYNPSNNKLYIADVRSGTETKIWVLDAGLPGNITCPASIPVTPTYTYSYVANNFEFDKDGTLWAFSDYNGNSGTCNLVRFDVNNGTVISTKVLRFSAGNFPTTISSGDLTILPNGRMFASLGSGVCRLYEIVDYNNAAPEAAANFLQVLPKDCYGIAYLNGRLELAGSDFNGQCYYYNYDISSNILSAQNTFQNAALPIDNASFTPAAGATKKLLSAVKINANTAELVYEIFIQNIGNTILNNVSLTDDLAHTFGMANVSGVSLTVVPGFNLAGLQLNPLYNGTTHTNLLNSGQQLPNRILNNQDYYFKVQLSCRVTNLNPSVTYLNSAVVGGDIGNSIANTLVSVNDSSNNGDIAAMDPNNNGNPSDAGENTPTPFVLGTVPVHFLQADATLRGRQQVWVSWQVALPVLPNGHFTVQYSTDAVQWLNAGMVNITNQQQGGYQFLHNWQPAAEVFYRVKQTDADGSFTYSKIIKLRQQATSIKVFPNPASGTIRVSVPLSALQHQLQLVDMSGRVLYQIILNQTVTSIPVGEYPAGAYILKIGGKEQVVTQKITIIK